MITRLKVLHIITHLPIGGAQDNTLYTVELLDRQKYDVSLACALEGELVGRARKIPETSLFDIPHLCREINPISDILAFVKLVKLVQKGRFDIVHTHSSKAGVLGRLAAFWAEIPIVVHTVHGFSFHDFMFTLKKKLFIGLEKLMGYITDLTIAVSELNRIKMIQLGISKPETISTIFSGIDFHLFPGQKNRSIRRVYGISDDVPLIGTVGRLSFQKDPMTLVSAFEKVLQSIPTAQLIFIGEGKLRGQLEQRIKNNKLDSKIHLFGNRDNVPELLQDIDVFAMSSLYEGLGRSITEAMACKIPVVCTAVEGVPELVLNGQTGLTVPPRDPNALAEGIVHMLKNKKQAVQMAANGQKKVRNQFDVSQMVEQIDNHYQQLWKRFSKGSPV